MKYVVLSAVAVVSLAGSAFAGSGPSPEMGEGVAGLSVLAAVAAGYIAVRRFRKRT